MRRLWSLILALVILTVPVLSLAETALPSGSVHVKMAVNLTDVPDSGEVNAISQLLDLLGIEITGQTNADGNVQAGFSLTLNGEDAVRFQATASGDELIAASNLLGDGTVAMTREDMQKVLGEAGLQVYDALMQILKPAGEQPAVALKPDDLEKLQDLKTVKVLQDLLQKVEVADTFEQPTNADPATQLICLNWETADLKALADALHEDLKNNMDMLSGAPNAAELTPEKLDEAFAELDRKLDGLEPDGPVKVYLDDTGIVAVKAAWNAKETGKDADAEQIRSTLDIVRNTGAEGPVYSGNFVLTEENDVGSVSFLAMLTGESANILVDVIRTEDGQEEGRVSFALHAAKMSENAFRMNLDVTASGEPTEDGFTGFHMTADFTTEKTDAGENVHADLVMYADGVEGKLHLTVDVLQAPADAELSSENAVRPGQMDEAALESWMQELSGNAMIVLFSALQSLPEDVLMLLN